MSLATDAADKPTLYKRIRADIEKRILTGEWPPGHRIPFEHELVARYGCSRMTVNKALSELAQADLIERRRRAGSFVRRPQHQSAVLKIADMRAEITALGRTYGYELIGRKLRAATAADRERLGVKKAGKVVAITCRHSADNVPFAVEDRLIDLVIRAKCRNRRFFARAAGLVAASSCPMDRGRAYDQRHCRG